MNTNHIGIIDIPKQTPPHNTPQKPLYTFRRNVLLLRLRLGVPLHTHLIHLVHVSLTLLVVIVGVLDFSCFQVGSSLVDLASQKGVAVGPDAGWGE